MLHDIDRIVASVGPPILFHILFRFTTFTSEAQQAQLCHMVKEQVTRMSVIIRKKRVNGPFHKQRLPRASPSRPSNSLFLVNRRF